jgi:hypothetical protein
MPGGRYWIGSVATLHSCLLRDGSDGRLRQLPELADWLLYEQYSPEAMGARGLAAATSAEARFPGSMNHG